jgi:glyoxylase-like metal-dependent hydrolase (beta-lactamase superfamily II)
MTLGIDLVVTSGVFELDGDQFDVDDNIWIVGDEEEVIVIDAGHDHRPILEGVGGRRVTQIVLTHGHNDHIAAAVDLTNAIGAPLAIHPDDTMLWTDVYPDRVPDAQLGDGDELTVAGQTLRVIHTPGHTPGGVCLYSEDGHLFAGGHTLQRRARCDGPEVFRLRHDHPLDQRQAAGASRGHDRLSRARQQDDDRR